MEFENGIYATISASTAFRPKDKEAKIVINGTEGSIYIYGIAINKLTIVTERYKETVEEEFETGYGLSHLPMIQAIELDLTKQSESISQLTIDTSIHTTEVISAFYYSSETRAWSRCGEDVSKKWGKS